MKVQNGTQSAFLFRFDPLFLAKRVNCLWLITKASLSCSDEISPSVTLKFVLKQCLRNSLMSFSKISSHSRTLQLA